jgi:hypothetical protein
MRSHGTIKKTIAALVAAAGFAGLTAPVVEAQTLNRNLDSYFIMAMRKASLKDMELDSACNVGVNCGSINNSSQCGNLTMNNAKLAQEPGGQVAGDLTFFRKKGAEVWDLFRNGGGPLDNVTIKGSGPTPFTTPILPNTCTNCVPDVAAIEALCGFPAVFPACDPAKSVKAAPNADCDPLALDTVPGNKQCDLAAGAYGQIVVLNAGRLNLDPGDYPVCSFRTGRSAVVRADATRILVADGGVFKTNNNTDLAETCGDLDVLVKGGGQISFGRHSLVAARVCAPESQIKLGHDNVLIGRFVGDVVNSDLNNRGQCCGGQCSCYDTFTPTTGSASAHTEITATGACDMTATTEVRVCGFAANITSKTALEIKFEIPTGAAGACTVEFVSASGTFVGNQKLTVNP